MIRVSFINGQALGSAIADSYLIPGVLSLAAHVNIAST